MTRVLFFAGDLILLVFSSALAATIVADMHQWVSPFIVASLAGMVVGMTVQMLLAMLAGSVLGSIESMVPTTMASMAATGFVCVLGLALPLTHDSGAWIGALVGVTTFAGMAWYRRCCDARFVRGDW